MGFFSARLRRKAKRPDSRQSSNSPAVAEADAPASPAGAHDAAADAERSAEQIAAIAAALELASQRESKELNSDTLILASSEDQARLDALAQTYVPITAPEGQLVSDILRVKGGHRSSYNFAGRVFVARITHAPNNASASGSPRILSLKVVDARGAPHNVLIAGTDTQVCGAGGGDPVERAGERFAVGALLAVVRPDCANIDETCWALVADLQDKSELHVFRPGTRLPPLPAAEAVSVVKTLIALGTETGTTEHLGVAFTKSVFGLKEALTADPRPVEVLEDMSAAAAALGREGLALVYAVAAVRLLWIGPLQCETAGHDEAALLRRVLLQLNKAEHVKRGERATHAVSDTVANARDLAAALYGCRDEWLEAPDLDEGAEGARVIDSETAAEARALGDAAWRNGWPGDALRAWRRALRKLLSDMHGSAAPAQLLAMRSAYWHTHETFDKEQGEAEELLDHMALWVLQSPVTNARDVRRAMWLGALGLGLDGADAEVQSAERKAVASYAKGTAV